MEPEDQNNQMDTNTPEEQPTGMPPQNDNGLGDEGQEEQEQDQDQDDQGDQDTNSENSEEE